MYHCAYTWGCDFHEQEGHTASLWISQVISIQYLIFCFVEWELKSLRYCVFYGGIANLSAIIPTSIRVYKIYMLSHLPHTNTFSLSLSLWGAMLRALMAVAIMAAMAGFARGRNYVVGAPTGGWDLRTNYTLWASTKTFHPGDTLSKSSSVSLSLHLFLFSISSSL